jgi:hypothetical protein
MPRTTLRNTILKLLYREQMLMAIVLFFGQLLLRRSVHRPVLWAAGPANKFLQ